MFLLVGHFVVSYKTGVRESNGEGTMGQDWCATVKERAGQSTDRSRERERGGGNPTYLR